MLVVGLTTSRTSRRCYVAGSRDYYLWDWIDPDPSSAIEELILEPAGRRYLVAALTLSFVDEDPVPAQRGARRPFRAPRRAAVARHRALEVEVDRGAATYPYPLPERLEELDPPGWGEPAIRTAVRSYTKIQAAPSATVRLRAGGDEIASFRWGDLEASGRIARERATAELIEPAGSGRAFAWSTPIPRSRSRAACTCSRPTASRTRPMAITSR
jgi:hypothetical protein